MADSPMATADHGQELAPTNASDAIPRAYLEQFEGRARPFPVIGSLAPGNVTQ